MNMQAKYPVKVQAIHSQGRMDRFYVFIPLPLAAAIGLEGGEELQWSLRDRDTLWVRRVGLQTQPADVKKPKQGKTNQKK
jgi:hypothetical protein